MGMDVSGVNNQAAQYYGMNNSYTYQAAAKNEEASSVSAGATVEISSDGKKAYDDSQKTTADGTVTAKDPYATSKMSKEDRAALVQQLQADQEQRTQSLINMVKSVLGQQAQYATSDDGIWKFLASGEYTVDAQTKADAQAAIAEDGYYGVKQTSERLFEFAQALAGDDEEKMKEMQEAIEKGFKLATKAWGKDLPDICQNTMDAVNQMFDDYYNSKTVTE